MVNLKIDKEGSFSHCNNYENSIYLGVEFKEVYNKISDKEFNDFLSDTITHEFVHNLIYRMFNNNTASSLFDVVEHNFCNYNLKKRVFNLVGGIITWHDSINNSGYSSFLDYYLISQNRLLTAFEVMNKRENKILLVA